MRRAISDTSHAEWRELDSTKGSTHGYSLMSRGWFLRELKLPVAAEGRVCMDAHGLYARHKYFSVFSQLDAARAGCETLRGGVLFTGAVPHWHFVMDGLATLPLDVVRERGRIYVDLELDDGQRALLSQWALTLTGTRVEIQPIGADCYELDDVLVPCRASVAARVDAVRSAAREFARHRDWPPPPPPLVYFVSRAGASTRRVINEREICERLGRQMEVQLVQPETQSLEEQFAMFRNARGVVGGHGSGLTNAVFSQGLEFIAEFRCSPQPFFAALARACGCPLVSIEGRPHEPGAVDRSTCDMSMDAEDVAAQLAPWA